MYFPFKKILALLISIYFSGFTCYADSTEALIMPIGSSSAEIPFQPFHKKITPQFKTISQFNNSQVPVEFQLASVSPLSPPTPAVPSVMGELSLFDEGAVSDLPPEADFIERVADGVFEVTIDNYLEELLNEVFPANLRAKYNDDTLMSVEIEAILDRVEESLASQYDFLVFLPTEEARQKTTYYNSIIGTGNVIGLGRPQKDNIEGIGFPAPDAALIELNNDFDPLFRNVLSPFMNGVNRRGRLQGLSVLPLTQIADTAGDLDRFSLEKTVLVEEIFHRWGVYLGSENVLGRDTLGWLQEGDTDWSPFFNAGFSPLDGMRWQDLGNGQFRLTGVFGIDLLNPEFNGDKLVLKQEYNDFELYAMGVLAADQVQSSFVIDSPQTTGGQALTEASFLELLLDDNFLANPVIQGTRRTVTIDDVIAAEGNRNPLGGSAQAQTDFNIAFVTLKSGTETTSSMNDHRGRVNGLVQTTSSLWSTATRSLSTLTVGGDFDPYRTHVLNQYDVFVNSIQQGLDFDGNQTLPQRANLLSNAVTRANGSGTDVDNLLAKVTQIQDRITARIGELGNTSEIQALQTSLTQLKNTIDGLKAGVDTAVGNATEPTDKITAHRATVTTEVNKAQTTGILPLGFGAMVDGLLQDIDGSYLGRTTDLGDASDAVDDQKAGLDTNLDNLLTDLNNLVGPPASVNGLTFNAANLTVFGDVPVIDVSGTNTSGSGFPGFIGLRDQGSNTFEAAYDLRHSQNAEVSVEVNFLEDENFSQGWTFAMSGAAGSNIEVTVEDANGFQVKVVLSLLDQLTNYVIPFSGLHVPASFDVSSVKKATFRLDRTLLNGAAQRDLLHFQSGALPIVQGTSYNPSVHTPFTNDATFSLEGGNFVQGRLPGFARALRQSDSHIEFLYELRHSSTSWVKQVQEFSPVESLGDVFTFGAKGANGVEMTLIFEDEDGDIFEIRVALTSQLLNYTINFNDFSLPSGSDLDKIKKVSYMVSRESVSEGNGRGTIEIVFGEPPTLVGQPFNQSIQTELPLDSLVSVTGGNSVQGRLLGFVTPVQTAPSHIDFRYDLRHSSTALAKATVNLPDNDRSLPEAFSFSVDGPDNSKILLSIKDVSGNVVEKLLELRGFAQNYVVDLSSGSVPQGFDRDNIEQIEWTLDRFFVSSDELRGSVVIRTKEVAVVPGTDFIAGDHQNLSGNGQLALEGKNSIANRLPGFVSLLERQDHFVAFRHDLRFSRTAQVEASLNYAAGTEQNLPASLVFGAKGADGAKVRMTVRDKNGNEGTFLLAMTGSRQNYTVDLGSVAGLDRTQISSIRFLLDRPLLPTLSLRDEFEIHFQGMPPV